MEIVTSFILPSLPVSTVVKSTGYGIYFLSSYSTLYTVSLCVSPTISANLYGTSVGQALPAPCSLGLPLGFGGYHSPG